MWPEITALRGILIVLATILLTRKRKSIKFYIKITALYTTFGLLALIILPYALIKPQRASHMLIVSSMFKCIGTKLLGLHCRVVNPEKIRTPSVIISNHQSVLDTAHMLLVWEVFHPCSPVLKRTILLYSGPFGLAAWLCGCIFIERSANGRVTLTNQIERLRNQNVWIFPEGTRNTNTELLPFKKGAFHMAIQAQVPIQPVVFSHYSSFYSNSEEKFESAEATMTFLEPIATTNMTASDVDTLIQSSRDQMQSYINTTPNTKEDTHM